MNNSWMLMVMAIPLVAIIGGLINAGLALHHRARLKELALRERIAMIEKGITPPPEVDPAAFDASWDERQVRPGVETTHAKYRTAGVILTGVGLGLMLLISLTADDMAIGIGVGGGIVILGLAFLVNSILSARTEREAGNRRYSRSGTDRGRSTEGNSGAPDLP
jgi:hypothetical protein